MMEQYIQSIVVRSRRGVNKVSGRFPLFSMHLMLIPVVNGRRLGGKLPTGMDYEN